MRQTDIGPDAKFEIRPLRARGEAAFVSETQKSPAWPKPDGARSHVGLGMSRRTSRSRRSSVIAALPFLDTLDAADHVAQLDLNCGQAKIGVVRIGSDPRKYRSLIVDLCSAWTSAARMAAISSFTD